MFEIGNSYGFLPELFLFIVCQLYLVQYLDSSLSLQVHMLPKIDHRKPPLPQLASQAIISQLLSYAIVHPLTPPYNSLNIITHVHDKNNISCFIHALQYARYFRFCLSFYPNGGCRRKESPHP